LDSDSDPTPATPETAQPQAPRRPLRSFVLREGRFTEAQRRAFEQLWPRYGIDCPVGEALDLARLFGPGRPVYAEIGFGNGEALASLAAAHPEAGFLGMEMHRPGIGRLLRQLDREGQDNVRLIRRDAVEVLELVLPAAGLDGLYVLFPDPWPKTRHHKRRLVQTEFLTRAARVLRPGGFLHLATDWAEYAQQMLTLLESHPEFTNAATPGSFLPRPASRPLTHFEQRGRRLGHGVWDLLFRRTPDDQEPSSTA
jgi:tRNA (guanine-N7-)-methyltransferase